MEMNTDFSKVPAIIFCVIFSIVIAILCPGFAILYVFKPAIIAANDMNKLLLFSCCISAPFWISNAYISILRQGGGHVLNEPGGALEIGFSASFYTIWCLYGALAMCYIFKYNFSDFMRLAIAIEFPFAVHGIILCLIKRSKNRQ